MAFDAKAGPVDTPVWPREAVPREEALGEIERSKGKQFDPAIVAALPRALERLERDMPETRHTYTSVTDTGR